MVQLRRYLPQAQPACLFFGELTHDVSSCSFVRLLPLMFGFGGVASLFGEEPAKPVKIRLHPQAAPTPAMKYRLLPGRLEQKRGNAAVHYGKVTAEEWTFFGNSKLRDQIDDWQETPLEELRGGKVHLPSRAPLRIRFAAERCAWSAIGCCQSAMFPITRCFFRKRSRSRVSRRILAVRARIQIARS